VPPIADAVEVRPAVIVTAHSLAVDDAGSRAETGQCLDNLEEAVRQVIAWPAVEGSSQILPC
jgi:hypothetical protein